MTPLALALALAPPPADPFARDNLFACAVVAFDTKKRSPEDRAAMLARLGFRSFAYSWRAEHLPTFGREVAALKANGVRLAALWVPGGLTAGNRKLLDQVTSPTQLWVVLPDPPGDQAAKVKACADWLAPLADEAAKRGHRVGLYNHGGWPGEPENLLAVVAAAGRPHVGIVYNLHHGHDHLDRLPQVLAAMKPHLLCLNLNGTTTDGERRGRKILPLGQGDRDLEVLQAVKACGYAGPVGLIGHSDDDVELRLADNLAGLDWLRPQLAGTPPGPKPLPKTLPPPVVRGVSPAGDRLPANTLRFYLSFSTPMTRGEAAEHLSLLGDDGEPVADPFLDPDQELWSADGTRLTVLLHPGRVKRGIASSPGPVLEPGKRYTLAVAAGWPDEHGRPLKQGFRHTFAADAPQATALDPAQWRVTATPNRVTVTFDRALDEPLVARLLTVVGVPGVGEATPGGRGWRFTPRQPLPPGEYTLTAPATLEDPCGNRVGRAFEAAPDAPPETAAGVKFRVR